MFLKEAYKILSKKDKIILILSFLLYNVFVFIFVYINYYLPLMECYNFEGFLLYEFVENEMKHLNSEKK